MNKTIWMCWFQGEDDKFMPELNKKCIQCWKELNPSWQVNVLSNKNIADYVPEYFDIVETSPQRNIQATVDTRQATYTKATCKRHWRNSLR